MAADVQRYLNDEPVEACPPSAAYRLRKTVRRHKGLLITIGLVVLTALIGIAVSLAYARKASTSAKEAVSAKQKAENHAAQAADNAREAQENARAAAEAEAWSRTLLYASDMKLASDAIAKQDMPRAAELLSRHVPQAGEPDLRGFEWHFFQKQVNKPELAALEQGGWVDDVEVSPNGKWLATTAAQGTVRLYETRNWTLQKSLATPSDSIHCYAWSPDGQRLAAACADGYLRVWDVTTDSRVLEFFAHEDGANDVAYSPDGQSLYSCGYDDLARRWNAQTGEVDVVFQGFARRFRCNPIHQNDISNFRTDTSYPKRAIFPQPGSASRPFLFS